jgi:hypothetical protein
MTRHDDGKIEKEAVGHISKIHTGIQLQGLEKIKRNLDHDNGERVKIRARYLKNTKSQRYRYTISFGLGKSNNLLIKLL